MRITTTTTDKIAGENHKKVQKEKDDFLELHNFLKFTLYDQFTFSR